MKTQYDVVVMGGGPAGSTAATLLAQYGHRVLLLEKERFPRHHIGESLMPETWHVFKRLGMLAKLEQTDFPRKCSVQFTSESGKDSAPYFFPDRDPGPWSTTWQVRRDVFDQMMLDNAREHGVEAYTGAAVQRVLFDSAAPARDGQDAGRARAVGVAAEIDGHVREIAARVVVDASGQSSLIARQLGLRKGDRKLKNAAIYSYYKGVQLDEGRNRWATLVISTPGRRGWFWVIPVSPEITSVGVVAPPAHLTTGRGGDPARTLREEIEATPGVRRRLEQAEQVDVVRVCSDFTYFAERVAGDGWVLVGDAFGFLDPVYSTGLLLALRGGEMTAETIHEGLVTGDLSAAQLGKHGPRFAQGMAHLKQLVYAFYDPDFHFAAFLREYPQHRDTITRLLTGDVFNDEVGQIFTDMQGWTEPADGIGVG